jgi:hypothetical protein
MEVNGIAHIFLTASNFEDSRAFYLKLLPFLGMTPVIDTDTTFYCVGGRTAVGVRAPSPEHAAKRSCSRASGCIISAFARASSPMSATSRPFCCQSGRRSFGRRARMNGRPDITRCCSKTPTVSGSN